MIDTVEKALFVGVGLGILGVLAVIDLRERRIPNVIVLPATAGALGWVFAVSAVTGEWGQIVRSASGATAYFAMLFVVALVSGGMGFGDVKLGAFIGAVTARFELEVTVVAALAGLLIGGVVAAGLLLSGKRGRKDAVPFGPSMVLGTVFALLVGDGAVRTWFGL